MAFIAAVLLWLAAGRGVLRLAGARRLPFGTLARLASWLVAGAIAGAFLTTVLAVLGLPVRPWPLTGPAMALIAAAGGLPRRGNPDVPRWRGRLPRELAPLLAGLISIPYLVTAASSWTISNDEYAIWSFKGTILAVLGRVDPFLLAHDAAYGYASRDYPLLVPSVQVWAEGWLGMPATI